MKSKIQIEVLNGVTRKQLTELRDGIRKIEGLEAFDLQIAAAPAATADMPGKMSGGVEEVILHSIIAGVVHFTSEKTVDFYYEKIAPLLKRISEKKHAADEPMSGNKTKEGQGIKVAFSESREGLHSLSYFDNEGITKCFTNREYSIDPDRTYALLIGTADYDDKENFSSIPPVVHNINDIYDIFTDKTLMALPARNVTKLLNENCITVKEAVRDISRTPNAETIIIYYTGHGHNSGNQQLSLVAKDTRNIDEDLHNDIPYSFIEKMLTASSADQKILFIDACHSGLAAQGNSNVFDPAPVTGTFTLASTSAEEASYFKRDSGNTYFTSYLVDVFRKGIHGINKMLSLEDLYEYTQVRSAENKLPAPKRKSQLVNITADKYFLSGNPGFSVGDRLSRPGEFMRQHRYEDAKKDYLSLLEEYPDNLTLRKEYTDFEKNMFFSSLVKEGDELYYRHNNPVAAKAKYNEALSLKYDEVVNSKIKSCEEGEPIMPMDSAAPEEKKSTAAKSRKPMKIAAMLIPLALLSLLSYYAINKMSNKEPEHHAAETEKPAAQPIVESKKNFDTVRGAAAAPLNVHVQMPAENRQQETTKPAQNPTVQKINPPEEAAAAVKGNYSFLTGKYKESGDINWLSFSSSSRNRIALSGFIESYDITDGYLVPTGNGSFKVVGSSLLEGSVTVSNEQTLNVNLHIKNRNDVATGNIILKKTGAD